MTVAEKEYIRLSGSGTKRDGSSFFSVTRTRCTLWLGKDHLLQVELQGGYSEAYKRFYFRDIQTIIVAASKRRAGWNLVLGLPTAVCIAGWGYDLLSHSEIGVVGIVTGTILTSIFAILFLINNLPGPTCTCHLKTAVHLEELPSLCRLRAARKVIARLKPFIEQAQGIISRTEGAAQLDAVLRQFDLTAAGAAGRFLTVLSPATKLYRSRTHQMLFWLLLADAFVSALKIFLPSTAFVVLGMALAAALIGIAVLALVKQHNTDLKPFVRTLTWVAAIYIGVRYFVGYNLMVIMISPGRLNGLQWEYVTEIAKLDPLETPWLLAILVSSLLSSGALGVLGMLGLRRHWLEKQALSTPPPAPPATTPQP